MIRHATLAGAAPAAISAAPLASAQVQPPLEDVVVQDEILHRAIDQATGTSRTKTDDRDNEIDVEADKPF